MSPAEAPDFLARLPQLGLPPAEAAALAAGYKALQKKLAAAEFKYQRTEMDRTSITNILNASIAEINGQKALIEENNATLNQALRELKAAQDQLVQREKLASLGELVAGIAHEIQNPLNFVNNFADLSVELLQELAEELARPAGATDAALCAELLADVTQNLTKIAHHGRRADSIVKGMLEHSRAGSGERGPTHLPALADEYLRLSYHGLRAKDKRFNATFDTAADPALGPVPALGQELGRVLLNLFNNAFYAVYQRQQAAGPGYVPHVQVRLGLAPDGRHAEIRVQDNGLGMPAAVQAKIFQPFFTTKPTGEGTGLGLSLSYDIISKGHGGTLAVESVEGEGTTFVIALPLA